MCGFPLLHLPRQIQLLVGHHRTNVALIEERPIDRLDKRRMRALSRIYTPGNLTELDLAQPNPNNAFLLSFGSETKTPHGSPCFDIAFTDLSTGELHTRQVEAHLLPDEISRIDPVEIILSTEQKQLQDPLLHDRIKNLGIHMTTVEDLAFCQLKQSGISADSSSADLLNRYLQLTLMTDKLLLGKPTQRRFVGAAVALDVNAFNALEIRKCAATQSARGSLMSTINRTVTTGGQRMLMQRLGK